MKYFASGLLTLLTLSLILSQPVHAVDPYVDTGFTSTTPSVDTDLIIVREQFIGATGVDLSAYGIVGGPHTYVQSVYFRLFVDKNSSDTDSYAGLVVFPNSITIIGILTEGLDLGGSNDDGIFTESDSLFGIGTDADRYSESDRGFETSGGGSSEYIGVIDNSSFAFALNVGSGVDDFRVIIDYGDSFPADLSFDVLGIDVMPPGNAAPVAGIRVGNDTVPSVFGSGDYGETLSLQHIPLRLNDCASSKCGPAL